MFPDYITAPYITLYKRIRSIAPDEDSLMLLLPLALFSDSGGNESCTDFDDRQAINSAQELYAGLLEKYLKSTQGNENGRLLFPRVSYINKRDIFPVLKNFTRFLTHQM